MHICQSTLNSMQNILQQKCDRKEQGGYAKRNKRGKYVLGILCRDFTANNSAIEANVIL